MTKIFLIRHAEAEGNLYRRAQGHYNSHVTPRGLQQIEALAKRFQDIPVDAVYSSDLRRASLTATAISRYTNGVVNVTPKLREINLGVWENVPWGNIKHDAPDILYNFSHDPNNWHVEGCEPFSNVASRMVNALHAIAGSHDGQTAAIFSHGMAIRTLVCAVTGCPPRDISKIPHFQNTSVALLEINGGSANIMYLDDFSHLSAELQNITSQRNDKNGVSQSRDLRFVPLDLPRERNFYIECYSDAWMQSNGNLHGFDGGTYVHRASIHASRSRDALMRVELDGETVGIIELDTERGKDVGAGWITLFYLMPDFRGQNLAIQLLGHAVSLFRAMGRNKLCLHVTDKNTRALHFYSKNGFVEYYSEPGLRYRLLALEKDIS